MRCDRGAGEMQIDLPKRPVPRPGRDELLGVLADDAIRNMSVDDLVVQEMRVAAEAAMKNAYCRYSKFRVGAAVLSADGEIFAGCNVENASYGLTSCAERNAIFQAVAKGAVSKGKPLQAVVIVTPEEELVPPCGACRQVINEFNPDADIFVFGKGDVGQQFKLSALLPHAFGPGNLGK